MGLNLHLILAASICGMAADKPAFEVASIRPNLSVGKAGFSKPTADGWIAENVSVQFCIQWAWNLPAYRVPELKGAEFSARYDIAAKAAAPAPVDQIRLMLQSLLEERFHLKVHFENKAVPVYALVLAKGGPKQLHDPAPGKGTGLSLESTDASGAKHWAFHNAPLSSLAGLYSAAALGRPILDLTGLNGKFDYAFTEPPSDGGLLDHIVGDVFPEIQRQLGIRVVAQTAPADLLIVDHLDKTPTEN